MTTNPCNKHTFENTLQFFTGKMSTSETIVVDLLHTENSDTDQDDESNHGETVGGKLRLHVIYRKGADLCVTAIVTSRE